MSAARTRPEKSRTVALTLQNPARSRSVPPAAMLRRWAQAALQSPAAGPAVVTVRVVGAAESQRLNREYRGRDYATNVLSFAYGRAGRTGRMSRNAAQLQGDLVLCAAVVYREARRQGKPVAAHYAHLLVHGLLHLQGYGHGEDQAAGRMERRERRILAALGFPGPY